jgi:transcriptional regulator with XRE-family HTH domain
MTQSDLAAELGIGRDYLAHIEAGRSVTLLDLVVRLLRRLGATITVSFDEP